MTEKDRGKITVVATDGSFNLERTLESGQCFRWQCVDGIYTGTALGHTLSVFQDGNDLFFYCSEEDVAKYWTSYFALDTDYNAIRRDILRCEPQLGNAAQFAEGIHILKQEPWETLCSFIISQNSNIPKIKRSVDVLCRLFGNPTRDGGFSFPTAQRLAGLEPEELSPLRCGYRAPYIIDAARRVANKEISFEEVCSAPIEQARNILMTVKGVGKKVADCSLLYGFGRLDCFPVDRWIARAMERYFPNGSEITDHPYAGVAQLYIFYMMINEGKNSLPA